MLLSDRWGLCGFRCLLDLVHQERLHIVHELVIRPEMRDQQAETHPKHAQQNTSDTKRKLLGPSHYRFFSSAVIRAFNSSTCR